MIDEDDIDGLAAEYVLGSLDDEERRAVAMRRRNDPALDRAIKAWEARLGPLGHSVPGIAPPPHIFPRLADRLWANPIPLVRPPRSRRALVAAAFALAACLALLVVWPRDLSGFPSTLTAQLQRSAVAGAVLDDGTNVWTPFRFEVSLDFRSSTMVVSPVAAAPSPTQHYQLWLLPQDSGPPISLGMIVLPQPTTSPWLATYPPDGLVQTTLAVSLEPAGGSTTGKPSGPLVFVGKLSKAAQ
jgi:anti-sigma-K factor RskA